ncbi:MAG: uroporphyrinogen-III synthase, partial [Deltaproteobacteria bacterium]|nr:uroporphyrinogen-III synthase [Deltaproteobacteria bacterium]
MKDKKILITRSEDQSAGLRNLVIAEGAEPVDFPTIAIAPPDSFEPFDAALKGINSYGWVFFTSANGVNAVIQRASKTGVDIAKGRSYGIAAVGKGTAKAL